jgi:hypothetical protein
MSKLFNKTKTIIIIKSINGNIFGGYTPLPWNNGGVNRSIVDPTNQTFIFSLKNSLNLPIKFPLIDGKKAIFFPRNDGPTFGDDDLFISNNSHENNNSYSRLINSSCIFFFFIIIVSYDQKLIKSPNHFISGENNFTSLEIESFEMIN